MTTSHDPNIYKHGTYNAICDVCGFKHKAVDMQMRWDGLFVCKEDFELRHILDFGRTVIDKMGVDNPRVPPKDKFIDVPYVE